MRLKVRAEKKGILIKISVLSVRRVLGLVHSMQLGRINEKLRITSLNFKIKSSTYTKYASGVLFKNCLAILVSFLNYDKLFKCR